LTKAFPHSRIWLQYIPDLFQASSFGLERIL